ncbi:hypothetical protein ACHQM5_010283 [Ranunculus cassubicifolius]
MEEVRKKIKWSGSYVVPAEGTKGGLAMFWKEGLNVDILFSSRNHITGMFTDFSLNNPWYFTFIYGHPVSAKRKLIWNEVRSLTKFIKGPWVILGDFNAITRLSEKQGGRAVISHSMEEFNDLIDEVGLIDLGFTGPKFTWSNHRQVGENIRERLDRVLGNQEWVSKFPNSQVKHISTTSDHIALALSLEKMVSSGTRPFRFHQMWLCDKNCKEVVKKAWIEDIVGSPGFQLEKKFRNTRESLKKWNKEHFGNIFYEIKKSVEILDELGSKDMSEEVQRKTRQEREKLEKLYEREELLWRQKSGKTWIREGGRNTNFFHLSTICRRRRNHVTRLRNNNGEWVEGRKDIGDTFIEYFKEIFTSENPQTNQNILNLFQPIISEDDNKILTEIPTGLEIWRVVKKMGALKAPGPDGFQGIFFKNMWEVVGPLIIKVVQRFFETTWIPTHLNDTFLALIPKTKNPEHPMNFRPISLCNFSYKIISKILANRLKIHMDNIISPFQGAFVKGRSIGHNTSLVQEVFHRMKGMKKKKEGWVAFKMDMAKAYDRVEWCFVIDVLKKLGFSEKLCSLVYQCISTTSLRVLLNGSPFGCIKPSRGLRQGDPLSPYLFILVAEAFSRLVVKAEEEGKIHGIKVLRRAPSISHLLYADDLVVFTKATIGEVHNLMDILKVYCKATGQSVNYNKSSMFFSKNVHHRHQKILLGMFKMKMFDEGEKYLGVPILFERSKTQTFNFLVERVKKKVVGWKSQVLAQPGRHTLIKAVSEAIPIYSVSTNWLPTHTCSSMDSANRDFWWNGSFDSNAAHTLGWGKLLLPKYEGGLGFKDSRTMNKALLGKHWWELLGGEDSLWSNFFKSVYPNWKKEFLGTKTPPKNASYFWKGLHKAAHSLKESYLINVGNGGSIDIFSDPWLVHLNKPIILGDFLEESNEVSKVAQLIEEGGNSWDRNIIQHIFPQPIVAEISQINPRVGIADKAACVWSKNGLYSVRGGYWAMLERNGMGSRGALKKSVLKSIWRLKVPASNQMFIWKLYVDGLLTGRKMMEKRIEGKDINCCLCGEGLESTTHLFFSCQWTRRLWFQVGWRENRSVVNTEGAKEDVDMSRKLIELILNECNQSEQGLVYHKLLFILQAIWVHRNDIRFNKKMPNHSNVIEQGERWWKRWLDSLESKEDENPLDEDLCLNLVEEYKLVFDYHTSTIIKSDGAFNIQNGIAAAGVVMYNDDGNVQAVTAKNFKATEALEAEIMAIELAIDMAKRRGKQRITIMGDCKDLMEHLQRKELHCTWSTYAVYCRIISLATEFEDVRFRWSPRVHLNSAHVMAQWASRSKNLRGSPPVNSLEGFILI